MAKKLSKYLAAIGGLAMMLNAVAPAAYACSRVLWANGDQVLVGRTQDWTEKVNSTFRKFPRGIQRVGAVAENPHKWTSKYGSLVITGYDLGTHEGVNEKGLSAHLLYLADDADFGKRDPNKEAIGVLQWVQYYLDNFATVAEAVDWINKDLIQIEPMVLPNGKPTLLHLSLSDKTGDSAVVEYVNGKPDATSRSPSEQPTRISRTSPTRSSAA